MITALVLAAGRSRRMGQPKMPMPYAGSTVLGHVVQVLREAGVEDVLIVSGGDRAAVEEIAAACSARTVFNADYEDKEMLSSLQAGLRAMGANTEAALIVLGDQPQIQIATVRVILNEYAATRSSLIVPSYQMRRGHPWLIARELWKEILNMRSPQTPRDFLNQRSGDIHYLQVDTPTILQDLDTPEDYERLTGKD